MTMALKSLVNTARHATATSCTCTVDRETVPSRHGARDMNNITNSQSWQMNCNDTKLLARMTGTMPLKSLVNTARHATAGSYTCTVDRETVSSHGTRDMNNVTNSQSWQMNCNDTKLLARMTGHWDHLVNEAVA